MGLAQYIYKTKINQEVEIGFENPEDKKEIHYWIKSYPLDGWMNKLYTKKGEKNEPPHEFNMVNLLLTKEDLVTLKHELENRKFGTLFNKEGAEPSIQQYFEEEATSYLTIVNLALQEIEKGYNIYYRNSW